MVAEIFINLKTGNGKSFNLSIIIFLRQHRFNQNSHTNFCEGH